MLKFKYIIYCLSVLFILIISCISSKPRKPVNTGIVLNERLENLNLSDLKGRPIKIKDYIGKPIFINFWASWCGPCKAEMKIIEEIADTYKNEIVFLLASDEEPLKIKAFIEKNNFDLNFIRLNTTFIEAYIVKLPTTLLIDREGKIFAEEEGFRIWTQPDYLDLLDKLVH